MKSTKAIIRFKERYENQPDIDHVIDFLNYNFGHKKSINFNYQQALEKANQWVIELNSNKNLNEGKTEVIINFDNGMKLVHLLDQDSKNFEGICMRHCVSSYSNHEGIYSLRDENNRPHCTFEIVDSKIIQIKGKANGKVSPKYIKYVIDILNYFNFEITNEYELEKIGYTRNININFIKKYFKNYKIIKIKEKEFLYIGNRLKLKEDFKENDSKLLFFFSKFNNCLEAIELLIKNGANIHEKENFAIRIASCNGNFDVVKLLIQNGANVGSKDNSSLKHAIVRNYFNIVKILIESGASVLLNNNRLLTNAIVSKNINIIKYLFEKGAYVDSSNDHLFLETACIFGNLYIIKFLVERGANINIKKDNYIELALARKYFDIAEYIQETN